MCEAELTRKAGRGRERSDAEGARQRSGAPASSGFQAVPHVSLACLHGAVRGNDGTSRIGPVVARQLLGLQRTRGNQYVQRLVNGALGAVGNHDLRSPRFAGDPVLEAVYDGERLLKRGDRGPAVEKVQSALVDAECPLPRFGADGDFGGETQGAVMCFQRASGLEGRDVDGIVGPVTMGRLDARFTGPSAPGGGGGGEGGPDDRVCGLPDQGSGERERLVPAPHEGDATIVCDGEGGYRGDLRGYASAPCYYADCVRLHEGVHCENWKDRWPRGCMREYGLGPKPDGAEVPTGGPGYREFLRQSECQAWEMTRMCVAAVLPGLSGECREKMEVRLRDAEKMKKSFGCP